MVITWPWARKKPARRRSAPIDVPTRPRLHLLAEIERGRVRYLTGSGQIRWRPSRGYGDPVRSPIDVTDRVGELVRARWAAFEPSDEDPKPHELHMVVTAAGLSVLMSARIKARKRRRQPFK